MSGDERLFRVVLRFEVHHGMEEGFEATWREIGEAIAAEPAVRSQWLLRDAVQSEAVQSGAAQSDAGGPATYWIMSDWSDEQQFRAFELGAAHLEHRKRLNPYRAGVWMTTMHITCHMVPERAVASRPVRASA